MNATRIFGADANAAPFAWLKNGGRRMADAKALYEQAKRIHRLAATMYTPAVVAELETHARRLEESAARLEEAESAEGLIADPSAPSADGQE
jgi:hypothetical protein